MSPKTVRTPKPALQIVAHTERDSVHVHLQWRLSPTVWSTVWSDTTACRRQASPAVRVHAVDELVRTIGLILPPVEWDDPTEHLIAPAEVHDWPRVVRAVTDTRDRVLEEAREVETGWRRVVADAYGHSNLTSPALARLVGIPERSVYELIKSRPNQFVTVGPRPRRQKKKS